LQVLHKHVRPVVTNGQAIAVGPMAATERMNLAIMLPLRNQADLTGLLNRLYDPSSPDYHHFLSVAEFTDRFGPTEQDFQGVVDFARANGFTVTDTPVNRLLVDINGTVDQIQRAFHVNMMMYKHPTENRNFHSPDREPSLALSVPISHIAGLNDFSIPRRHLSRRPEGRVVRPNAGGSGPQGSFQPSDMRAAYYGGTALTGSGQSVAMFEFDGYNIADVNGDLGSQTNNVSIVNILIDGASAASDGNDGEQALDIAQAIGMAPGLASIRVYIAPINTSIGVGDVDEFNKIATDNLSKSISCSWGWTPEDHTANDPIFQQLAAQGQTLFVASGDSGPFTGSNAKDFSFPAEDPFVVAVGGTDLTTNGAGGPWQSESAWVDSGGGPSDDGFALPSYQQGIANSSNGASNTIRNVPDVAGEANFDNILCSNGSCTFNQTGGTSYAAPRWAGFIALVNQQSVANGNSTVGFINPAIYSIGKGANFNSDLHDITTGNSKNSAGKTFNAVIGYDLVTGWGSPNGQALIDALAGAVAPVVGDFSITATPASATVTAGAGTSYSATVTGSGGFNSSVGLTVSGLPTGASASFSPASVTGSGSSTLSVSTSTTTPAGTYTLTVTGTVGSLVHSTSVTLVVNPAPVPDFTISVSPTTLAVRRGTSGSYTVTITGVNGFSGGVSLTVSGQGSRVTTSFNPTSVTGSGTSTLSVRVSSRASTGNRTLTIKGTSGSLSHSTSATLTIQ
jgi:subtilase family serine protease